MSVMSAAWSEFDQLALTGWDGGQHQNNKESRLSVVGYGTQENVISFR